MPLACSSERKYQVSGHNRYTGNIPVFTNTGTFQYLMGPEVYFFQKSFGKMLKGYLVILATYFYDKNSYK